MGLVLIALVVAVGALWHAVSDGAFAELAESHVSHSVEQGGGLADALMY